MYRYVCIKLYYIDTDRYIYISYIYTEIIVIFLSFCDSAKYVNAKPHTATALSYSTL